MNSLHALISYASGINASDIHLSLNEPPRIRVDGDLIECECFEPLTFHQIQGFSNELSVMGPGDYAFTFVLSCGNTRRLRINAFDFFESHGLAIRLLPDRIRSLEELEVPTLLNEMLTKPRGLVLITGPTGSGKSSTLAACIDHINTQHARHIITLEDPIEVLHKNKMCLVRQREIGTHVSDFPSGLHEALRQDPDVLVVAELRDRESILLALNAAETGHLVLGTLHTMSAAKTIDRIVGVFDSEQRQVREMLSESLVAVISQTLVKRRCGSGRIAAFEVLVATPAIRSLIRDGKTAAIESAMFTGATDGMCLMSQALGRLTTKGLVPDQAIHSLLDSHEFSGRPLASYR